MRFQVLTAASMKFRVALMMEAVCTSETSVNFNETTTRHIPENSKLHTRHRENLKSYGLCLIRTLHVFSLNIGRGQTLPRFSTVSCLFVQVHTEVGYCDVQVSPVLSHIFSDLSP